METFLLNLLKTSLLGSLAILAMLVLKPLWRERYRSKTRCWLWLALAGFAPNVLDERDVHYQCDCSAERTKEMLFSLGRKELVRMRDEDPACEVVCHFCHSKYQYDLNDLLAEYDAQAAERAAAEQGT